MIYIKSIHMKTISIKFEDSGINIASVTIVFILIILFSHNLLLFIQ